MKLLKLSTALLFAISIEASEIKPFGNFNFGDSFTPVYKSLCSTKGIKTIKLGFSKAITKDKFCNSKQAAINEIIKSSKPKYGPSPLNKVRIKNCKNIARYNLYIRAEGINIKGVDFQLQLQMGTFREEQTVGSYLLTKDDTIKIDKFFVPLQLEELMLKPKQYSEFKRHQKDIFNILWKKYGHLVKKDNIERQKNGHFIQAYGKDGTSLIFGGSDGIVYNASNYLDNLRNAKVKEYMKNIPKNKNDASDDL